MAYTIAQYQVGHIKVHSGGILYQCPLCGNDSVELTKVALGDWRCRTCIPDHMKPPEERSRHDYGDRLRQAIRDCAPARELFLAVAVDDGLQEVPRTTFDRLAARLS